MGGVNQRNYSYDAASPLSMLTADARLVGGQDAGPITLFASPAYDAAGQLTAASLALNPSTQQSTIELSGPMISGFAHCPSQTPGRWEHRERPLRYGEYHGDGAIDRQRHAGSSDGYDIAELLRGRQQAMLRAQPLFVSSSILLPNGYHTSFVASAASALGTANAIATR